MRRISCQLLATLAGLALASAPAGRADDVLPPCWRGQPDTTFQSWRFDANANPASPEQVSNPHGAPQASAGLGLGAGGWINQLFLFGTNQGVWDLGGNGTMTIDVPNQAGPAGSWKYVWVQVSQYRDGLYSQLAAVTISGATRVGGQLKTNSTTSFGGKWVVEQSLWLMEPCPGAETVVITAGNNGAAIDHVVVDTRCATSDNGDIFPPCWRSRPGTTYQNWSFHSSANPMAPEEEINPGSPLATVSVGLLGAGWQDQQSGFGCRQGYWDLGSVGTIQLDVPNTAGSASSYKYVRVQVVQFQDSLIYNQLAAVGLSPSATLVSRQQQTIETTLTGAWVVDKSIWRIAPCPAGEIVTVTAGLNSSLVDQVVVDTLCLDIACPVVAPQSADPGQCSLANVTWSLPVADGCILTSAACSPASGSTFPVGTTSVTCTITDGEGGTSTCNFNVTVTDNEPPTLVCPANLIVVANPTLCGTNVSFTSTASDNCPGVTVSCVPPSGSVFPLGQTPVTCTAVDAANNSSAPCSFLVTVIDLSGDIAGPCWRGQPATTFQHWAFHTPANPAVPELSNNGGSPSATVTLGALAAGWQDQPPGFGCKQGYWDLGGAGTISLDIPNVAQPGAYKYVRVQVTQFQDSLIYNQLAAVALTPSATLLSRSQQTVEITLTGSWVVDETVWQLATCPASETVLVTAGPFSSLIDQVVVDTLCLQPPVCPLDIAVDQDPGQCSAAGVAWSLPAANGCTILGVSCTTNGVAVTNPGTFPVGQTIVNCVITDAQNQASTCVFRVTVRDVEPPVIVNCAPPLILPADASCQAPVPDFTGGVSATDCSSFTVTQTPPAGSSAGLGPNVITLTVTDAGGRNTSCTTTLTVIDLTPPTFTATAPDQSASADAACQAVVPDVVALSAATDNCDPSVTLTQLPAAGTLVGLGGTVITVRAIDDAGNSAIDVVNFVVSDTTPPTFTATAPDQSASAGATCQAAVPDVVALSAAADNCDTTVTLTQLPAAGALVGLGTTVVTVTATDDAGNSATDLVSFVVSDTTAPTFTATAPDQSASAGATCQAAVPDVVALSAAADNCDTTVTLTQVPAAGALVGLGTTVVTVTATDDAGNSATDLVNFVVSDTTPPVIATCAPAQTVNAGANCEVAVPDFTAGVVASDACDATLAIVQSPAAGTLVGSGPHTVTLTVSDDAGNSATCATTFTVQSVADLSVQVVSAPDPVTVGQPVSYTVTVENLGPCTATGVSVNNVLSAGQVLMSVTDPGTSTARACPTPGPSAWWRAEGDSDDSVGTSDGAINGTVGFTPQAVGQGFTFDGLTGYISVPDAPALRPASLTIEGWIKIGDPNGLHVLLSKPQGGGSADSYSVWISSGVLFAAVSDNAGSGPLVSYPNFPSSSLFTGADIIDLPTFAGKLKVPVDPLSIFLNSQLSPESLTLLAAYGGGTDNALLQSLVRDLNEIIQSGAIYTPARFLGVILAPETQYLLGRNPTGIDLVRLNRMLIRDGYPAEIRSDIFPELNIRYHFAYTYDPATQKQALYINGALVDASFVNKTIAYDNHALFAGAANVGGVADHFYQGELDELTLYPRALSGIEVQAVYNAGANGKCFNTGPVALGTLAGGASRTVTVVALPTVCPSASLQATVSGNETDPIAANNVATATSSVVDLPADQVRLSIRRISPNNDHVEISWPITCDPYELESSDDLSLYPGIIWSPTLVPLQILQGRHSTVIPASDPHRFFRLKKP